MTGAAPAHPVLPAVPLGILIGGSFDPARSGATFAVTDPASDRVIADVADAGPADATAALDAAVAAQAAWAATAPRTRSDILRRAFELMLDHAEDLALIMTLEMGKPLAQSRSEVVYAADFLRWFSEEAVRIGGRTAVAPAGDARIQTLREPVGPCLLITPWNFPLAMVTRKIGPALAAGCTAIIKPATATPLSVNAIAELLLEAGLPAGVLSVLPTSDSPAVVARLLDDRRLSKISFTGSTAVGRQLIAQSATNVLRMSMELGGNAPFIVCEDADIPRAVEEALKAKLRNNGEACTAANAFWVHESVVEEFTAGLAARWQTLVIGPGYDDAVDIGPVIGHDAADRIAGLVEDAVARGGRIVARVEPGTGLGSYCPPTLLAEVSPTARIVAEEIFGPVAPIVSWSDEDALLAQLNDGEYGLAGYLFTRDAGRIRRLSEGLQVGMIGVNRGVLSDVSAPFGGVKHSGFGREGGEQGIEEYLSVKYLAVDATDV